jgi:hypothetical protein
MRKRATLQLAADLYKFCLNQLALVSAIAATLLPAIFLILAATLRWLYQFGGVSRHDISTYYFSALSASTIPVALASIIFGLSLANQDLRGPVQLSTRVQEPRFRNFLLVKVLSLVLVTSILASLSYCAILWQSQTEGRWLMSSSERQLAANCLLLPLCSLLGLGLSALIQRPSASTFAALVGFFGIPSILAFWKTPLMDYAITLSPLAAMERISTYPGAVSFSVTGVRIPSYPWPVAFAICALWAISPIVVAFSWGKWADLPSDTRGRKIRRGALKGGSSRPSPVRSEFARLISQPMVQRLTVLLLLSSSIICLVFATTYPLPSDLTNPGGTPSVIIRGLAFAFQNQAITSSGSATVIGLLLIGAMLSLPQNYGKALAAGIVAHGNRRRIFWANVRAVALFGLVVAVALSLLAFAVGNFALPNRRISVPALSDASAFSSLSMVFIYFCALMIGYALGTALTSLPTAVSSVVVLFVFAPTILGGLAPALANSGLSWVYNLINLVPSAAAALKWSRPTEVALIVFNGGETSPTPVQAIGTFVFWAILLSIAGFARFTLSEKPD